MPDADADPIPLLEGLSRIAARYDGLLVDLWGCLHNGVEAWPEAVEALLRFRRDGGSVVLLSNAPRDDRAVADQLAGWGVPGEAWDSIVTAGLAVRLELAERADARYAALGRRFHHIGSERDAGLLDGLGYERVATAEQADFVLCCGVRRPGETLDGIWPALEPALERGLPMVSANPDKWVLRGAAREMCAGTIAEAYAARGGIVLQEGKPWPAVYRRCRALMGGLSAGRTLAIGDGVETDIAGARDAGVDAVWITGGLPAHDWGVAPAAAPPRDRVAAACAAHAVRPVGVMPLLRW